MECEGLLGFAGVEAVKIGSSVTILFISSMVDAAARSPSRVSYS